MKPWQGVRGLPPLGRYPGKVTAWSLLSAWFWLLAFVAANTRTFDPDSELGGWVLSTVLILPYVTTVLAAVALRRHSRLAPAVRRRATLYGAVASLLFGLASFAVTVYAFSDGL
jgi:hypothetical protein